MDSMRLGVGSAENLLNAVLEIHFATYKTALRPPNTSGSSNVFASLVSQLLTACSSCPTTASRFINAAPASAESQNPQRTPQRPPPTPCKPCRARRIKPSLPNRTLPRTRRIVKTTNRQKVVSLSILLFEVSNPRLPGDSQHYEQNFQFSI